MNILNRIGKYVIIFLIIIMLFSILLTMTNFIPRDKLYDNVKKSAVSISEYRKIDEHAPIFYDYYKMDYYTDSVMVNIAYFTDQFFPLKSAMSGASYGWGVDCLSDLSKESDPNTNYSRYWHGYLVFLRPLLMFFDYIQIGILNTYVFYLLLCSCLILFYKKIGSWFSFSFMFTMVLLNITILPINFQLVSMFFLSMIGMIVITYLYEKKRSYISTAFFILGMLTMFFDFYTYAILTFGFPAIVLTLLYDKDGEISLREMIKKIAFLFMLWVIGYAFTWIVKILLAAIILGRNELELALISYNDRIAREIPSITQEKLLSGLASISPSLSIDKLPLWAIALGLCAMKVLNKVSLIFIGIIAILIIILCIIYKTKKKTLSLALFIISLLPILWYVIAVNPTIVHYYFQYRGLGVTALGILSALFVTIDFKKVNRSLKNNSDLDNKKTE